MDDVLSRIRRGVADAETQAYIRQSAIKALTRAVLSLQLDQQALMLELFKLTERGEFLTSVDDKPVIAHMHIPTKQGIGSWLTVEPTDTGL